MGIKLNSARPPLPANTTIPMEREMVKFFGEFFGRSILNKKGERDEKGNFFITVKDSGQESLRLQIDEPLIDEIKNKLGIPKNESITTLSRQSGRLWLTLIVLAYEQFDNQQLKGGNTSKIVGEFTYRNIIKIWGIEDGQKTRKIIRDLLFSLHTNHFVSVKQLGGRTEVTSSYPVPKVTFVTGANQETVFRFELSDDVLGLTANWIRMGEISKSLQREGYLALPVSDIKENERDTNYLNFRERLRLVGGDPRLDVITLTISGKTMLEDWIKLDDDKLKRRAYCRNQILSCLEKAKAQKELLEYEADLPLQKGWLDLWTVSVSKVNRRKKA
jgi:hypothetical protein